MSTIRPLISTAVRLFYKDIVDFASKVPAYDCGAYYSDIRSALTDAITNVVQNNADIDSELETAQSTVEFSIEG